MKTTKRNARFWVWENMDWVKLTIPPGGQIERYFRCRTDEGWASNYTKWTFDGHTVGRYVCDDGADCDGRLSYEHYAVCPVDQLHVVSVDGIERPDWQFKKRSQIDYQA